MNKIRNAEIPLMLPVLGLALLFGLAAHRPPVPFPTLFGELFAAFAIGSAAPPFIFAGLFYGSSTIWRYVSRQPSSLRNDCTFSLEPISVRDVAVFLGVVATFALVVSILVVGLRAWNPFGVLQAVEQFSQSVLGTL